MNAENQRLEEARVGSAPWRKWGPYLSERAWGTVREDYSPDGRAWDYFPHDQARSKAYRWNEDGLAGICDDNQNLCFALALWNGHDAILKERLFGLTGNEGKHGEDVKELYFFLDNTPSHAYQKALYKYPHAAFPYQQLLDGNNARSKAEGEYELLDTGVFDEDRYFDVVVEYAKAASEDVLIKITATNRGPEAATLHLLPTLWFRNVWSWGYPNPCPKLSAVKADTVQGVGAAVQAEHKELGDYWLLCHTHPSGPKLLFCDNETNSEKLYNSPGSTKFPKDGINDFVVNGVEAAINPAQTGTKVAAHYALEIGPGATVEIRLRLTSEAESSAGPHESEPFGEGFDAVFALRLKEADEFYALVAPEKLGDDARLVQRQALAGLLWSKQFYNYNLIRWLRGDPSGPTPPAGRWKGRNHDWKHLNNHSVMSMPDPWEYPWYAAWDLAFHTIPFAMIDSEFAKDQLVLMLREWFMHPNGQLPAYEWAFGDVNPPVHAWAALRVFRIERKRTGKGDFDFLERVFHKLLLNFTWWVNRKDDEGRNIFQGGFLGLDNIGMFDRSAPLPGGAHLDQADGTAWMATYCLNMLAIALELAREDCTYEDVATKFLEHFFYIAHAMNDRATLMGEDGIDLWDDEDGFYYDVLRRGDGGAQYLKTRSLVGLIPLLAVETIESDLLDQLPTFRERMEWFLKHRPDLTAHIASLHREGEDDRRLFAVVDENRLRSLLQRMLDENEFLSPHGLRSVSRVHMNNPVSISIGGTTSTLDYEPGESTTSLFGGNSNWRGPIWFPLNYLLIEALQKFDYFYGEGFKVECPIGSGQDMTLWEVSTELSRRLMRLFTRDEQGRRAVYGDSDKWQNDPHFKDYVPFYEYFHGDTGMGLGAMHQTGWTSLVAKLIQQSGDGSEG